MENEKFKWFKIAFFISLGLNLCFLCSYLVVFSKLGQLKSPEGRIELVAHRLKLSVEQKDKMKVWATEIREHRKAVRQKHGAEIAEFRSEMAKENPDYNRISQLMTVAVEEHCKTDGLLAEKIQDFIKILTPQQRQSILKRLDKLNKLIGG